MGVLPFLPGYSFDEKYKKTNFRKSQSFEFCNNIMTLKESGPEGGWQTSLPNSSDLPPTDTAAPRWFTYEKQSLMFKAFWQESVTERRHEFYRVHSVNIFFFLEDDTIQVVNDREIETGLPEGIINKRIFIKRHRIKLPPPNVDKYYTMEDFNIGKEVTFYGKTFRITAYGDLFTENFLKNIGYKIYEPIESPLDPEADHYKKFREKDNMALRPHIKTDSLGQFLQYDKNVLRFYGYWDDTEAMFGDIHDLIILFYLVDDTVEIREKIMPNSGRDSFPIFLKRGKLPKKMHPLLFPGQNKFPVLNVLSSGGPAGEYYIQDCLKMGEAKIACYKDNDLMIGAFLNAHGRKIVLCDCDEFTREYYRTKYGITDFTPLKPMKKEKAKFPPRQIPPHNGFGSEEDSLQNVLQLLPTPPKKDFMKFITLDRQKSDSHILRFLAQLTYETPLTKGRLFVIYFYLVDDTISIFELTRHNSGIYGGKFLERSKIRKPKDSRTAFSVNQYIPIEYYQPEDFYVGAFLDLNSFKFTLIDADEYCLHYMEDHPQQFPQSNINLILRNLKQKLAARMHEVKTTLTRCDLENSGIVEFHNFRDILLQFIPNLTEHEILTLARSYMVKTYSDAFNIKTLLSLAQKELHKCYFDDFSNLVLTFKHYDTEKSGKLSRKNLYTACRAFRLPVSPELLKLLIDKLEPINEDKISYEEMVALLNWRQNPMDICLSPQLVFETMEIQSPPSFDANYIRYMEMFADIEKN